MLENLMTLAVAKVKSVGLVAGTAMVTTALVGGGAVAVTVVSNDTAIEATTQQLAESGQPDGVGEQHSDAATATDTAANEGKSKGKSKDGDNGEEGEGCGAVVSAVASNKAEETSGREHGAEVSRTARECNGSLSETEGEGPGKSAGKGNSDNAGEPATRGEAGTAGRPDTGPGSEGRTGRPQADDSVTTQDDEQENEAGAGRPNDAGSSAGRGGSRS